MLKKLNVFLSSRQKGSLILTPLIGHQCSDGDQRSLMETIFENQEFFSF